MAKLRLSELYVSVQGEGPRTGLPTQFVRFAGCNMRCPGWPCDTQHAILPELYINDSTTPTPSQLVRQVALSPVMSLCLTGGEPFLQPNDQLQEFVELVAGQGYNIECFTNGSFILPEWAMQRMTFMMDWKLPGSGEHQTALDIRIANAKRLRRSDGIKFVIACEEDLTAAQNLTGVLKGNGVEAQFWVGAAYGKFEPSWLVDYMLDSNVPWRLNVQTHKYVWPEDKRGV